MGPRLVTSHIRRPAVMQSCGSGRSSRSNGVISTWRRAGLPWSVPTGRDTSQGVHILRHTFCSHLAMKGAPRGPSRSSPVDTGGRVDRAMRSAAALKRYGATTSRDHGRAKGGAGYGNRTRLTGLGSQDITTMLSPPDGTRARPAGAGPTLILAEMSGPTGRCAAARAAASVRSRGPARSRRRRAAPARARRPAPSAVPDRSSPAR